MKNPITQYQSEVAGAMSIDSQLHYFGYQNSIKQAKQDHVKFNSGVLNTGSKRDAPLKSSENRISHKFNGDLTSMDSPMLKKLPSEDGRRTRVLDLDAKSNHTDIRVNPNQRTTSK